MNKCFLKATAAIRTEKDEEMLEAQINGFLGEAITIGQKIAKDALKEDNNMVRVIKSGAKGNFFNITQVTGVVGQQNVVGNRIPKTYGGRTLPHYIDYSNEVINEIEEKEKRLQTTQANLGNLTHELIETKQRHENQIAALIEEHNTLLNMKVMENDLIVKDLKHEKEANVKRLNKLLETQKSDNDKMVFELRENLETKTNENNDLNARVKEFEETLAKDKDERIQRLLDTQHNLEKEIESLKAALEIKNIDIYDLRTKNNELITKVDNYTDLNAKVRRFEQEVEQLNVILKKLKFKKNY
jgi:hypothetical protein